MTVSNLFPAIPRRVAVSTIFSDILAARFSAAGKFPSQILAFHSSAGSCARLCPFLRGICMRDIAIVGGGPAGAMCGERLARFGYKVTLYDEHLAWEKPCGGGLTHKAIQAYPFLLSGPHPKKLIRSVQLISSKGHRALLALDQPIVIYSRATLNGLLLERAEQSGCRVVRSRVSQLETSGGRAKMSIGETRVEADFVV